MGYGISIQIDAPFAETAAQVRDAFTAKGFGVLTESTCGRPCATSSARRWRTP